jgi:hypothetical protein
MLGIKYSAYNHKRAIAAKCRRTDATTAVPFPDSESAVVSAMVWLTTVPYGYML